MITILVRNLLYNVLKKMFQEGVQIETIENDKIKVLKGEFNVSILNKKFKNKSPYLFKKITVEEIVKKKKK